MTESNEAFFINKCSSMSFKELSKYLAMCFEYLENPQKHLANVKKVPFSKEAYDIMIKCLESKLTRVENLVYCKNEFESFGTFEIFDATTVNFDTLVDYHQLTENDKKSIETKILSNQQRIIELILILLRILLSEIKIALIFLNSTEPTGKILNSLIKLSESNEEIKKVIINYRIENFQKLLLEKFQFSNSDYCFVTEKIEVVISFV